MLLNLPATILSYQSRARDTAFTNDGRGSREKEELLVGAMTRISAPCRRVCKGPARVSLSRPVCGGWDTVRGLCPSNVASNLALLHAPYSRSTESRPPWCWGRDSCSQSAPLSACGKPRRDIQTGGSARRRNSSRTFPNRSSRWKSRRLRARRICERLGDRRGRAHIR